MTKLYHGPEGQGWTIPGAQDRKAERHDVPSSPAELAAWLNERHVPAAPCNTPAIESDELEAKPWIRGPVTKDPPRVSPAFLGAADARVDFIPVDCAAEIDRQLQRCPKCHGGWAAQVLAGIPSADVSDLELIAQAIRSQAATLREELEAHAVGEGQGRPS